MDIKLTFIKLLPYSFFSDQIVFYYNPKTSSNTNSRTSPVMKVF